MRLNYTPTTQYVPSHLKQRLVDPKGIDTLAIIPLISSDVSTNASSLVLNDIRAGPASYQHNSNYAVFLSLRLRGIIRAAFKPDAAGTTFSNTLRLVVVWDRNPVASAYPAFSDIFGYTYNDGSETNSDLYAGRRLDQESRYTVLLDRLMCFDPQFDSVVLTRTRALGGFSEITRYVDETIQLDGLESRYDPIAPGDGQLNANIQGVLSLYVRAERSDAETSYLTAELNARLRFH